MVAPNNTIDGDRAFIGVDERRDPSELEPGLVSEAENKIFSKQDAEPRPGFVTPNYGWERGFAFPFDFSLSFTDPQGFGDVYGANTFADPNSNESVVVALERYAERFTGSGAKLQIRYPEQQAIDEDVLFVQAYDKLLMFRGQFQKTWRWDGTTDEDFEPVEDPDEEAGKLAMPNSSIALFFQNRIWVVDGRDEIVYSDIGVFNQYNLADQFKVNQGSSDRIVGLATMGDTTLFALKENSVSIITNIYGDIQANARLDEISPDFGLSSRDAVIVLGSTMFFMNESGIFTISLTSENNFRFNPQPFSTPIQPTINRINFQVKEKFSVRYHNNKLVWAVALDSATYLNYFIIYDFLNDQWAGRWTSDFLDVHTMIRPLVNNTRRLGFVAGNSLSTNDGANGALYHVDTAFFEDIKFEERIQVKTKLLSRGYVHQSLDQKRWKKFRLDHSTWNPSFTVRQKRDGVNEFTEIKKDQTKSRTKYYTFNTPAYVLDNSNDDAIAPYRQDYSVLMDPDAFVFPFDFDLLFESDLTEDGEIYMNFMDNDGISVDSHQRVEEPYRLRKTGDYTQIEISNNSGRQIIHAIKLEANRKKGNQVTKA